MSSTAYYKETLSSNGSFSLQKYRHKKTGKKSYVVFVDIWKSDAPYLDLHNHFDPLRVRRIPNSDVKYIFNSRKLAEELLVVAMLKWK